MSHLKKLFSLALIACLTMVAGPRLNASSMTVTLLLNSTAVASTGVVTTRAVDISSGGYFGLWYQFTSASSSPDVKIEYEMSYDETSANFVEPGAATDIESSLTAETVQIKSIAPPPMRFIRFKITGNASNPADTVGTMYLTTQVD